jgi:hypothetical protein
VSRKSGLLNNVQLLNNPDISWTDDVSKLNVWLNDEQDANILLISVIDDVFHEFILLIDVREVQLWNICIKLIYPVKSRVSTTEVKFKFVQLIKSGRSGSLPRNWPHLSTVLICNLPSGKEEKDQPSIVPHIITV